MPSLARQVACISDENPRKLAAIGQLIRVLGRYQFKCELESRAAASSQWELLSPEIAADYREMLDVFVCAFTPVEHIEFLVEEATERFNDNLYERAWERVLTCATILEGIKADTSFRQALAANQLHHNDREDKASSQELAKEKWRAQPDTPIHEMVDTLLDILRKEKGRVYERRVVHRWIADLAPQEQRKPGRRRKD
jgi:hypothetical protein